MALYELSEQQIKNLMDIISNANVKGRDAIAIIQLVDVLNKPVDNKYTKDEK